MTIQKLDEETIFHTARKLAATLRPEYLQQVCGDDAALHDRVLALLHAHDESPGFLQAAAPVTVDAAPIPEGLGSKVGPYKLLQQIGEGGMGVVYMAEQQEPVRRKVALKIIKPGMDSAQVIARFEAERQALALMDHQNIARVLDAGATDQGRPFFVMELVNGIPITKYCDDNRLTPRERLEVFVPVCQAIQHAHQKGVIHRDIKPSNLLVTLYDGKPVPKVIDFGVAKATEQRLTDRTLFTQFGGMVGTFEYMAPEQAEMSALGVDTRSDIYSLGVLLYELLTGATPLGRDKLQGATPTEIIRRIKEEEPSRPSAQLSSSGTLVAVAAARKTEPARLARLVRGELDWIAMKCLEKDRTRRYETAASLAGDVQRYLADEPVEACPPSTVYRLRKFARKHKGSLAVCGAFVLLLLAGTVVSTWQAVWAQAESDRAQMALTREQAERERTQMALTHQVAERLDGELKQLATVAHSLEAVLAVTSHWDDATLEKVLRSLLKKDDRIHGLTLAYAPFKGPQDKQKDYCLYVHRCSNNPKKILRKDLLPGPDGYNPPYWEWDWYKKPLTKELPYWTGPGFDGYSKVWMVAYSVPMSANGERDPVGVFCVDLELKYFTRFWGLGDLNLGKKSYGFVVNGKDSTAGIEQDTTGVFVSHPDFGAGNVANKKPKKITDLAPKDSEFDKLTRRILNKETGRGTAEDPAKKMRSTFLFTPLSSTGWSFVAVIQD